MEVTAISADRAADDSPIVAAIPAYPAWSEWLAEGYCLAERMRAIHWAIADWAARGVSKPSFNLYSIPHGAPFDVKSVRKFAKISNAFPTDLRDDSLPFDVHADLASLPDADRQELLATATIERWNSREARKAAQLRRHETAVFNEPEPERAATRIIRAWNNAPAAIREYAWDMLQIGAERGFTLVDEEQAA